MRTEFRDAIYSQPENLRAAGETIADALAEVDLAPLCTGTIVFSGIGASAHALTPAVLTLRAAGRRAFSISPAELRDVRAAALGDAFVLVSQSGTSMETVQAIAHLDGVPAVAISAHGESPLAEAAGAWLPLGPILETEVATLSYTATLQALGMLCDALLETSSPWRRLPDMANEVLMRSEPAVDRVAEGFATLVALDAVGGGAAEASARETALLGREGLHVPAVGMETREYLHGPLEAVADGFGCVVFGRERERELATALGSFGANVAMISDESGASAERVDAIGIPHVPDLVAPILQILPAQLLVDDVARRRGLEIGRLRRRQPDTKLVGWPAPAAQRPAE
jgi:glucosamine--fructose-6-phosphate aminotransferase (isomerizing)